MQVSTLFLLITVLPGLGLSQTADVKPTFDPVAIYASRASRYPAAKSSLRAGRIEIRTATLLDLIANAYGVGADKVLGGPSWLDTDRFDVVARMPPNASPQTARVLLQAALAERFGLAIHGDQRLTAGFILSLGNGKPKMNESETSESPGCQRKPTDGATIPAICRGLTMQAFAQQLRGMAGDYLANPVVDQTKLEGAWDFGLQWTPRGRLVTAGSDGITIFDAVDKQLGLKLEAKQIPAPVIVVDDVNRRPTQNPPEVEASLPPSPPLQFEVATIKPSDPQVQAMRVQTPPNGLVNIQGATLGFLIQTIWFITPDMIVGAPKWLDTERWDIAAKVSTAPGSAPQIDMDSLIAMVRTLLEDRFELKTHPEQRNVPAYTLTAVKPRMQKADPANRTGCKEGPAGDAKDPRLTNPALSRLVACHNITMAEFAEKLPGFANALNPLNGPIRSTVLDSTGLTGTWDFTLNFSPEVGFAPDGPLPPANNAASDPNGKLSLSEAIGRQLGLRLELVKRPATVLVIDHIEAKPAEN
jgi:uncharacterized protein (TIGR03435 family)